MSTIFTRNLKPDTGTTLRKVLQLGLEPYMEQFEIVSAGASKVRFNHYEKKNLFSSIHVHRNFR